MKQEMATLGYPDYLVFPLGVAKLLAVISIFIGFNKTLKEWAYAGLLFNLLLAIAAHLTKNDGDHWGAIFALVILGLSYWFWRKNKGRVGLITLKAKRS